jgi:predicted secreted protein
LTLILARAAGTALLIGLASASALAQVAPPAPAKPQDRNQKICEKVEITGSRLAAKRVCMTRGQWEDARLQDRQEIERVQTQRGMKAE